MPCFVFVGRPVFPVSATARKKKILTFRIATALSVGSEVVSLIINIFYSVIFFQIKDLAFIILCCPILHFLRAVFSASVLICLLVSFSTEVQNGE